MRAHHGVTLTEMLVATACLGCLAALLLPALMDAKDCGDRTVCAANLAHLGQALRLYAGENNGYLPDCGACSLLGGAPTPGDPHHFPSGVDYPGSTAWPHDRRSVGNQANLWILVRQGYAVPAEFLCPATQDRPSLNAPNNPAIMGFLALDPVTGRPTAAEDLFLQRITAGRCSYSYQNQFAHPQTAADVTDVHNPTTNLLLHAASLAVMADRNPYTRTRLVRQPVVSPDDQPEANSLNHGGMGQNVLYLDGSVQWQGSPLCGAVRPSGLRDNIYWPDAGLPTDPQNIPRSVDDSFLVP
jgi:type II secretory pathway pseudopilin PulG